MAGKARDRRRRPSSACIDAIVWARGAQWLSTAWSTARMPVDNSSGSGVCSVACGSSTATCGTSSAWPKPCLARVALSVTPAREVKSAAESVVDTESMRIGFGGASSGSAAVPSARKGAIASGVSSPCHRQASTALVPSIEDPPPTATSRSARAARAAFAAAITSSRGLWARMVVNEPAQRSPSARCTCCSGPSSSRASDALLTRNARFAPSRCASAAMASPAGSPKTMRSCAWIL